MEYLALLLPVCLCWRARHLPAATAAAALIIAAAGSRGGTASLVYLIPVLAVTFVLSYRLGYAGGWRRTIAGPALLAATAEVINPHFNPFFVMVTFELDGCGGAGLLGMTERVKAHGGQLSSGPVPGGGWRVAASLPSGRGSLALLGRLLSSSPLRL